MNLFRNLTLRRFCRKEIIYALLLSLAVMCISYIVQSSPEIQSYYQIRDNQLASADAYLELYSSETAMRIRQEYLDTAVSHAFSFYIFMENGFSIYHFVANFIITLPVLMYWEDRKNGTTQLLALRNESQSIIAVESIVDSLLAGVLVIIPSIIFWGITAMVAPFKYPITQSFTPPYNSFFQILGREQNVVWLYLVLILLVTMTYISKAFLTCACSLYIRKKALILFIPILYTYLVHFICSMIGLPEYGKVSYFDAYMKSLSPLFATVLLTFLLAIVLFMGPHSKERSLNE